MLSSIQSQWLLSHYKADPCGTLPNAFWKTMSHSADLVLEGDEAANRRLTKFAIWEADKLLAFRCSEPDPMALTQKLRNADLSLVHADAIFVYSGLEFSRKEAYFRIIHKDRLPDYNCPPGFTIAAANPATEVHAIAEMIRACYSDMQVDDKIISGWLKHPVYDPTLWVWVMDHERGVPAGLGIAEIDMAVPEASLEWIQVMPFYRGRGLGKVIVTELLRRVSGRVDFTTVSGRVDNNTRPEKIYRQCGFTGSDVWWLLIP